MKKHREPEALRELHKIREQIHKEAVSVGIDRYYLALNESSEWLKEKKRKPQPSVLREKPTRKYGSK